LEERRKVHGGGGTFQVRRRATTAALPCRRGFGESLQRL
jgi:hypothetical protein